MASPQDPVLSGPGGSGQENRGPAHTASVSGAEDPTCPRPIQAGDPPASGTRVPSTSLENKSGREPEPGPAGACALRSSRRSPRPRGPAPAPLGLHRLVRGRARRAGQWERGARRGTCAQPHPAECEPADLPGSERAGRGRAGGAGRGAGCGWGAGVAAS